MHEIDLQDVKYAIEKCINARTVRDIADILNDGMIHPELKEIIENVEIKQNESSSLEAMDLHDLLSLLKERISYK